MSDFSQKQFQELNELYQSMYNIEEVVEETQDELEEGILDSINNYKRKPAATPAQELGAINRAASNLMKSGGIGGAISRGLQSAQSGARKALGLNTPSKVKPGEKYGPGGGASAASKGTIGGLIKKDKTPTSAPTRAAATAGTYSSQFKKGAADLGSSIKKKPTPMMKSDLGGRLGKALSGKVSDFQFKDSYDMVLDYLLSGGHVASVEEAHYVMLEMDQETIQGICEGYIDENRRAARAAGGYKDDSKKQPDPSKDGFTGVGNMSIDAIRKMSARIEKEKTKKEEVEAEMSEAMSNYDRARKRAAQRAAARNAARDAGKTGVVPGVGYVTPRRERETYVDSAGTTRHKSGAKMEEVEAVDEALTGERYKTALKKGKMYSRMVSADPEKRATRGGRGGESDFGAGDRGTGNRSRRRRGMSVGDED